MDTIFCLYYELLVTGRRTPRAGCLFTGRLFILNTCPLTSSGSKHLHELSLVSHEWAQWTSVGSSLPRDKFPFSSASGTHVLAWVAWGTGDTCSASRVATVWPSEILAIQGLAHRPAVWAPGHPAAGRVASTTLDSSARRLTTWLRAHRHAHPPDHAISPLSRRGGWHTGNVTPRENATGETVYHPYASRGSHGRGSLLWKWMRSKVSHM